MTRIPPARRHQSPGFTRTNLGDLTMTSTFHTMTTEHLGPDAGESDLQEFRAICDGDYYSNARRLGVDVDAIVSE